MPSKQLLQMEKNEFLKYVKVLRKVSKIMVIKTQKKVIDDVKMVVEKFLKKTNQNFNKEMESLQSQFSCLQEENLKKQEENEKLQHEFKNQEIALVNLLRSYKEIELNRELSDPNDEDIIHSRKLVPKMSSSLYFSTCKFQAGQ